MAKEYSRIIVQSDWDQVLRRNAGNAWVTLKTRGEASIHSQLHSNVRHRTVNVTATDGFTVEEVSGKNMIISYRDGDKECRSNFLAPIMTFSTVHTPKKAVVSLDVTEGGLAISADTEGKLKIWTSNNGEVRRDLEGHCSDVYSCRFFPSGVVALSGGADMMLKIWSAETGECAATISGHKAGITDTGVVERGRNVVSVSRDGTAKLWDVGKQACLTTIDNVGGIINGMSLGALLSSAERNQQNGQADDREVGTSGKTILLACENGSLQGFDLKNREKTFEYSCGDAVNCCSFITSTTFACGTQDSQVYLFDSRNTSTPLLHLQDSRSSILSISPFQQGSLISTADGSCYLLNEDHTVTLELTGSDCDPVYKVLATGSAIYTACRDGGVRRYFIA